jgi:lysophospholipase L1-like esterase
MGIKWRVIVPMFIYFLCSVTDSTGGGTVHGARTTEGKAVNTKSVRQVTGNKSKLVIIGASYARGWTDFSPAKFTVVNKGRSGEQSFEMLARFRKDVIDERPEVVIIWGFINDIFGSSPEVIDPTLERSRKNITEMVDLARSNGIKPVLATEVTIREKEGIMETIASWIGRIKGAESYQDYVNKYVLQTNHWIRGYAREQGIFLLDFQPLLVDGKGRRKKEYATEDGSHLSAAAYARLSEYADKNLSGGL